MPKLLVSWASLRPQTLRGNHQSALHSILILHMLSTAQDTVNSNHQKLALDVPLGCCRRPELGMRNRSRREKLAGPRSAREWVAMETLKGSLWPLPATASVPGGSWGSPFLSFYRVRSELFLRPRRSCCLKGSLPRAQPRGLSMPRPSDHSLFLD